MKLQLAIAVLSLWVCMALAGGYATEAEERAAAIKSANKCCIDKGVIDCPVVYTKDVERDTKLCLSHCAAHDQGFVGGKDCVLNEDRVKNSKLADFVKKSILECNKSFSKENGPNYCDKCARAAKCITKGLKDAMQS